MSTVVRKSSYDIFSLSFEDSMIFMCCKDDVVFMFIVGHEDTLLLIHQGFKDKTSQMRPMWI